MAADSQSQVVRGRRGFAFIELLVAIASIAMMAGLLLPVFAQARDTARKGVIGANLQQIANGVILYAQDYDDTLPPRFQNLVPYLNEGLGGQVLQSELARDYQQTADNLPPIPPVIPYYVLSVRPGVPGHLETWDYRLAAALGADPLRYTGRNYVDRGLLLRPCLRVECPPIIQDAEISSIGAVVSAGEGLHETWNWNPDTKPARGGTGPVQDAASLLYTVHAAETITPFLEADPGGAQQVRAGVGRPNVIAMAFDAIDPNHEGSVSYSELVAGAGAAFAYLLDPQPNPDDLDGLPAVTPGEFHGNPSSLFSYESLRVLSRFYVDDTGIYWTTYDGMVGRGDRKKTLLMPGRTGPPAVTAWSPPPQRAPTSKLSRGAIALATWLVLTAIVLCSAVMLSVR